jgi:hypothetical protein
MEFQDKILRCVDCASEFVWTAGEQLFFADKQFKNEPKRCKACKAKRANRVAAGPVMNGRVETRCSARSASSSGSSSAQAGSDPGIATPVARCRATTFEGQPARVWPFFVC